MRIRLGAAIVLSVLGQRALPAQSFLFESTPLGYSNSLFATSGGLNLTITPEGFPNGFVTVQNSGVALIGVGVAGTSTNSTAVGNFVPPRFTFSQLVNAITFNYGDAGGDDDSPVFIRWYNAANTLLGSYADNYPIDFASGKTAVLTNTSGASYFVVGASPELNPNSILWDISSVTTGTTVVTPEPATVTLIAAGLVAMVAFRRRANRNA